MLGAIPHYRLLLYKLKVISFSFSGIKLDAVFLILELPSWFTVTLQYIDPAVEINLLSKVNVNKVCFVFFCNVCIH